jgi:hypothetical protein
MISQKINTDKNLSQNLFFIRIMFLPYLILLKIFQQLRVYIVTFFAKSKKFLILETVYEINFTKLGKSDVKN